MPSNAQSYFEQITTADNPVAFLHSQANGVFEEEWLDFKGQPQPKDTKGIWSEAVTGFSNTEGGVLVWGIDARYDPATQRDVSNGLRLITDVGQFESQLRSTIWNLTTPPTQGIQIKSYPTDEQGQGFVVCLIPEGQHKPYRAESGRQYYFIRSGTSFQNANPSLLRTMFFPKTSPDLRLHVNCIIWPKNQVDPNYCRPPSVVFQAIFRVTVENKGVASAEGLTIFCHADESQGVGGNWNESDFHSWKLVSSINTPIGLGYSNLLHPSQVSRATQFEALMPTQYVRNSNKIESSVSVALHFVVYAKDAVPRRFISRFSVADINAELGQEASIVEENLLR